MKLFKNLKNALVAVAVTSMGIASALAAPLTFVFSGTGSGSVGGTPFTNAAYTITVSADSASITGSPVQLVPAITSTVDVQGIGLATVTESTQMFSNPGASAAGFGRAGPFGADLFDIVDPALSTWDLTTPIYLTNLTPQALDQFDALATTLGNITLSSSGPATFRANNAALPSTVSVPTMSEWGMVLLVLAMSGVFFMASRRQQKD